MMAASTKPRLHYFDMLKGVAIFMVVMGHILTMCVREIDRATLFKFIERVHMPLFFFISGWFTYKAGNEGRVTFPRLGSRALQLLLPMVVVSSLWIWYFPHSGLQSPLDSTFAGLWTDVWKNGYWFTLVLFEIIIIYAAGIPLMNRFGSLYGICASSCGIWAAMLVAYMYLIPQDISSVLSLELVVSFYPAFIFGAIGRRYREGFMNAVHSSMCQTVAMAVFAVCLYMCSWPWEFGLTSLHTILLGALTHVSLAVIALAVFERWSDAAFAPGVPRESNRLARMWEYIGTQSLAIYLLHYFLLFPMGGLFRDTLISLNLSFVPLTVFSAFWAAIVIAMVLGIVRLIEPSRQLSLLLTGKR